MERKHYPDEMVEAIRNTLDCNPVFHGNVVSVNQMIGIMMGSIAVFGIIYYFVTLLPDGEGRRLVYGYRWCCDSEYRAVLLV